jgi:hypothetical protein
MHHGTVEVDRDATGFIITLPARQYETQQDPLDAAP